MKIVIKLGGELLSAARADELSAIAASLAVLTAEGHRLLVIHGGGPQTTALQKQLGQEPNIVGGRRVTDENTLDVIKMVVAGKLNCDLVTALMRAGLSAVGLSGVSARTIACDKRPPRVVSGSDGKAVDFGFVGDVTGVNHALLDLLLDQNYTPVLSCMAADENAQPYNINADVAAAGVARAVKADRLVLVTGTPGVLGDKDDPSTRRPRLTIKEARAEIDNGVIQGGMIPKVEEAFGALENGVEQVLVVGHLGPGDLEQALNKPGSIGTTFERE